MKKSKFLIGVLVLAVMLMGAGYALWSQSFDVDVIVTAGHMDYWVQALDTEVATDTENGNDYVGVTFTPVDPLDEDSDATSPDLLEYSVTDIYPGSHAILGYKVTNTGTMAIKMDAFDEGDWVVLSGDDDPATLDDLDDRMSAAYSVNGSTWFTNEAAFFTALQSTVLGIGESQEVYIKLTMDPTLTEDELELAVAKYDIKVTYTQSSDPATAFVNPE